jgi:hypothetical protein
MRVIDGVFVRIRTPKLEIINIQELIKKLIDDFEIDILAASQ